MDIYLDANATTPVLPQAQAAAQSAMADRFGNPSSTHSAGLKARALLGEVRDTARRVLGAPDGRLLFNSGATEGIQTAVLSALNAMLQRRDAGEQVPGTLLYGATEHKAVPEALKHWNRLLGLDLRVHAIPVGSDGRHDLGWLRDHAADAALVCTMAANNETGTISDLDGIAGALAGSPALWLVDGVQALGKLPLRLRERRIDYVPFSGHKLYAPKGIGMLYVRDGAPLTPLLVGGGQEDAQRAGTENMAGIAALGAVLRALESGDVFASASTLLEHRARLVAVLRDCYPGIVFNAAFETSLPTTLNVSVPGIDAQELIALFDAAGLRVSGGSACSATRAEPSYVLQAMGLPAWQARGAVRLSFGLADDASFVDEACARLRDCGRALRSGVARRSVPDSPPSDDDSDVDDDAELKNLEMSAPTLQQALRAWPRPLLVDVREEGEQMLQPAAELGAEPVPLSSLTDALPRWSKLPPDTVVVFVCRTGKRSTRAAHALRRQGHVNAWSLAGGLALWPTA